ncbi:hypothetical protein EJB05_33835, partial [Eragrostis curvula]
VRIMNDEGNTSLEEIEDYSTVVYKTFKSEEDCYAFYNAYAGFKGFSIRKDDVRVDRDTNKAKDTGI